MKRINHLVELINPCHNVIDVGSDHSYLAIKLLQQHKAQYVLNVEINHLPLKEGIKNLNKHCLLHLTDNVINDGLKEIDQKITIKPQYDYLVIAGMGANNITKILENNALNIKTFILQANNNHYKLRKYLIKNHYKIIKEDMVYENKRYYPIIVAKKGFCFQIYKKSDLYFGKLNKVVNPELTYMYLKATLNDLIKQQNNGNRQAKQLIMLTIKMVKKYESNWDL